MGHGIIHDQSARRETVVYYESLKRELKTELDNKFKRSRPVTASDGLQIGRRTRMPDVLQFDEESPQPSRPSTEAPKSEVGLVVPAPLPDESSPNNKPYAGMRDQGKIPTGVDKLRQERKPAFGKRISISESILNLGHRSPVSPTSPASPTTIRSPLRFFRKREDVRDAVIAAGASKDQLPALPLRERTLQEGVAKMDMEWERSQEAGLLLKIQTMLVTFFTFLHDRVFGGWRKWLAQKFALKEEMVDQYLNIVTEAPLHSVHKLNALESVRNLSYGSSNHLVMIQGNAMRLLMNEVKQARHGSEQQTVALATIRNFCLYPGYRVQAAKELTEMLIAVCWAVENDTCKQHALGALANLAANERPSMILLEENVLDVLLYLCLYGHDRTGGASKLLTDDERHVRSLALMTLFNLSIVPKNRRKLLETKEDGKGSLDTLQKLLQEPGAVGTLATITAMHLIPGKSHPMLVFSERQRNIPELVLCLKHSLDDTRFYGLHWNPRHTLKAINTLMRFEPNHRVLIKCGVDDLLTKVLFGQHKLVRTRELMDMARDMRAVLTPLALKLTQVGNIGDGRGDASKDAIKIEHERRAQLVGRQDR